MIEPVYFVAGEASGDAHGAALLAALKERAPALKFLGRGGPGMRAIAGVGMRDWIEEAAVVGLWEVIRRYGYFRREFAATIDEIETEKAGAVVLIDYPGFNLRLAKALRRKFSALKILYYISPQVWAWNRRRIKEMARSLDLMLCIFPFEPELYQASGLRAVFVGHPMASELHGDESSREKHLIALLPGSREREVRKIFPVMLEAANLLRQRDPTLRFEVAAASEKLAELAKGMVGGETPIVVRVGGARELLRRATAGMVASGTATLEAALARLPFVLVYRVSWLTYFAARAVVKVKHLGMPNVLAGREIVPEFIQHRADPRAIAHAVNRLVNDSSRRAEMLRSFASIAEKLGEGEAAQNAAAAILQELNA